MTQFVEQLRNQAKWYAQPGHNARDLMDSHLLEKAADEIESLERYRTAFNEWIDKTEWMQKNLPAKYLGMHRADALKDLVSELFGRLEAAERDVALKEKVIDALGSELNAVAKERDALRAKVAEMEKQEPVRHEFQGRDGVWYPFIDQRHHENTVDDGSWPIRALYALPGAKGEEK